MGEGSGKKIIIMNNLSKSVFLKTTTIVFVLLITVFSYLHADTKINFNNDWKFSKINITDQNELIYAVPTYNDKLWEKVSLPHTANIEPLLVNNQWQGICWYRKKFNIDKQLKNKKIYIKFEAAMNAAIIWVNGIKVKEAQGGYLPIVVDVTDFVKPGASNVIAVRLDNRDNPVTGPKPLKRLDFCMYGGLYRNSWLITKNKIHISIPQIAQKTAGGGVFITYPRVDTVTSIIKIKTHIVNENTESVKIEVQQTAYDKNKKVCTNTSSPFLLESGKDIDVDQFITIQKPTLWSPEHPHLYTLKTQLLVNGKIVDREKSRFGVREFIIKDKDLYINGVKAFLRGVNRHQEYPFVGYALSDNAQYRDAYKIKKGGFDYIRLSHYPQSPAFLEACDELGLVVVDGILGWQYYADNDDFRNFCYQSARDLIRRDRNHPCVLAWEVSLNETKMPVSFMKNLHRIVHEEFPGDNVYSCGWMDDVYDIYLQARQHRLKHTKDDAPTGNKDKPYIVSEYGDWEYYSDNAGFNQNQKTKALRAELSSRQTRQNAEKGLLQQAFNIQESHNDNFHTTAFADGYWVMYDYNRGNHNDLETSGVMDIFRIPKFGYYFFQSQRETDKGPMVYVASYWTPESDLNVRVFSNCEIVRLYLNDKLIAEQTPDQNNLSENLAHPPFTFKMKTFEAGSIRAVGVISGKEVAEHIVRTPQKAKNLKIWLDESNKAPQSNCNDVVFVYIAAIDENGTIIPDYNGNLTLKISGDAKIMNPEQVELNYGIATVLLKIGSPKGKIKINAVSDDLLKAGFNFLVNNIKNHY